MFGVEVNSSKNLLTIRYSGDVDTGEVKQALEQLRNVVPELKPGFHVLTDLSQLNSMDAACARYIRQAMDLCSKKGVERIVRVIPDPQKDIGWNILSLFHYRRPVQILTCETLEEALEEL